MLTDRYGRSISSTSMALLWCNMVSNIYNLAIISLTDKEEIKVLLGPHSNAMQFIIIIQTVLSIYCISLSFQKPSCLTFSLRLVFLSAIAIILFIDIMQTYVTAVGILTDKKRSHDFWAIRTHGKKLVPPDNFFYVLTALSTIYMVFKLFVAFSMLRAGRQLRDHLFNDAFFLGDDVEQNAPSEETISPDSPPTYEQCVAVVEDIPPPPYSVIQEYIQK